MPKLRYPSGGTIRDYPYELSPAEVAWYNYVQATGIKDDPEVKEKFIRAYNKDIELYQRESKELTDLSTVADTRVKELNVLVEDYNTNFKPRYDQLYNEAESLRTEYNEKVQTSTDTAELSELSVKYEAKVKELNDYTASYSDKTAKYEALKQTVDDTLANVKTQKEKVGSTRLGKFYEDLEYKKNKIVQSKQPVRPIYNRRPTNISRSISGVRLPR